MAAEAEVSISDPVVLAKYDQAAAVCNHAIAQIVSVSIPGARIFEICEFGDKAVTTALGLVFPEQPTLAKGIAFPTTVSVNNVVGNFSPPSTSTGAIKAGDIVKVEVGAHIDGIIAVMAHTFVPAAPPAEGEAPAPLTGTGADAICAAHYATEAALRAMKPGKKASEVSKIIQRIAEAYGCNAVVNTTSYNLLRYTLEGPLLFSLRPDKKVADFDFEVGQAYSLNVVISTGDGKPKEGNEKPTIFRRDNDNRYQLKMQSARTTYVDIKKRFPTLPFNLRALKDQKSAKLGMTEISKHGLTIPYPILYEKPGQFVAQFKSTVLILPQIGESPARVAKLTAHALPFVSSEKSISDPEILALIAEPLTF